MFLDPVEGTVHMNMCSHDQGGTTSDSPQIKENLWTEFYSKWRKNKKSSSEQLFCEGVTEAPCCWEIWGEYSDWLEYKYGVPNLEWWVYIKMYLWDQQFQLLSNSKNQTDRAYNNGRTQTHGKARQQKAATQLYPDIDEGNANFNLRDVNSVKQTSKIRKKLLLLIGFNLPTRFWNFPLILLSGINKRLTSKIVQIQCHQWN